MLSDALFDVASSAHALAPADDQNLPLTAALSWGVLNPSAIRWLLWQFNMQQRRKHQLTLLCLVGHSRWILQAPTLQHPRAAPSPTAA